MLLSKLIGERTKEIPSDAEAKSHILMLRAGYIKQMANGIYSLTMPALKIAQNIMAIIRQEMDAVDGQEVLFPIVMPKELWDETGRYDSIGNEMVRFKDRSKHDMLLGMTHEEASVQLTRYISSYNQLPFMIYQLQTKFRDEARSRAGLIRVREFTMKDAYSFHANQQDLEDYYDKLLNSYNNIFRRIGMKNVVAVKADSGMMGGSVSHEFMLLTDIGEDTVVNCPNCNYWANIEVATSNIQTNNDEELPIEEVATGDAHNIDEIAKFFNVDSSRICKAVVYHQVSTNKPIVVFIRGDKEVNEAKLKVVLQSKILPLSAADEHGFAVGNIGALNLNENAIFDVSLKGAINLITGANKAGFHIKNLSMQRDCKNVKFVDISKVKQGEKCSCGHPLVLYNGIEVGNIFQLGTKYTQAMNMSVCDNEGKMFNPIMGCYGIGVGRSLAALAEESADEKGLNWNVNIAPFAVHLCLLRPDQTEIKAAADKLYNDLQAEGIQTLYDDRDVSPGVKFSEADLMGMPIRIVVSPKSMQNKEIEITMRCNGERSMSPYDDAVETVKNIIKENTVK